MAYSTEENACERVAIAIGLIALEKEIYLEAQEKCGGPYLIP